MKSYNESQVTRQRNKPPYNISIQQGKATRWEPENVYVANKVTQQFPL
jgi:hypothetical protein